MTFHPQGGFGFSPGPFDPNTAGLPSHPGATGDFFNQDPTRGMGSAPPGSLGLGGDIDAGDFTDGERGIIGDIMNWLGSNWETAVEWFFRGFEVVGNEMERRRDTQFDQRVFDLQVEALEDARERRAQLDPLLAQSREGIGDFLSRPNRFQTPEELARAAQTQAPPVEGVTEEKPPIDETIEEKLGPGVKLPREGVGGFTPEETEQAREGVANRPRSPFGASAATSETPAFSASASGENTPALNNEQSRALQSTIDKLIKEKKGAR